LIEATRANQCFDLLSLIETDTVIRRVGANWWVGPCPFCGGRDRFVLKHTSTGWRWFCRFCGDGKYHTALDYIMKRESIGFRDALAWVGYPPDKYNGIQTINQSGINDSSTNCPSSAWQSRARTLVDACVSALWRGEGKRALDYLHKRGFADNTLKRYWIGYNPADQFFHLDEWGLPEEINANGNPKKVWLPRGIIIPCCASQTLYYLKVRRSLSREQVMAGHQKYIKVKGSKPGIFGVENLRGRWLAVLTEGEFDAMLLDQEAGYLAGVATLGSATERIHRFDFSIWGKYLLPVAHFLAAYDLDIEGEKGITTLEKFSERFHRISLPQLPGVKDITDLWKAGMNLGHWVADSITNLGLKPFEIG
jgi:DNA primase